MSASRAQLIAIVVREAGKTLENALGDVREAIDFALLRQRSQAALHGAGVADGGDGESNLLTLAGRGPFACISPWNFPLAIFTGQVAAALAAGNPVLAKPAEQTPIVAFLASPALHEAGGAARGIAAAAGGRRGRCRPRQDQRIAGVAFTGSNETGWAIQSALAARRGAMVPFIAETGGINAMIADSSALPEQVIRDLVRSAFDSAGQRAARPRACSLSRTMWASAMLEMLVGAVEALDIGDPLDFATDIGPVIDDDAVARLEAHKLRMQRRRRASSSISRCPTIAGTAPTSLPPSHALDDAALLKEVFGPILHVVTFSGGHLDKVIETINRAGYGLTLGVHSRIAAVAQFIAERARGSATSTSTATRLAPSWACSPSGGEGLSGTGPKAGGPNYLARFACERVRSTDLTATGGNVGLLGIEPG